MDQKIRALLNDFLIKKDEIEALFETRAYHEVIKPMAVAVEHLLEILYTFNHVAPDSVESIDQLTYAPPNAKERIDYVSSHLKQYVAFLQLKTLYVEVEKLILAQQILRRNDTVTLKKSL